MKLRAVHLYNAAGDIRVVTFHNGLNIITGDSATGKSALLDIVEFCLGRNTLVMPVGPITESVVWYGLLLDLPTTRAFVARPAPRAGQASTSRAMLEFGVDIEAIPLADLRPNADSETVREELGRMIGIDENVGDRGANALRAPLEANLGHAVFLCLQRQNEIANRDLLFHRQGEEGISRAIQDTMPYFLGAVPRDQAIQRQRLTIARRDLRSAEQELRSAEAVNASMEITLRSLITQALTAGLLQDDPGAGTMEGLDALRIAATYVTSDVPRDDLDAAQLAVYVRQRDELRSLLRSAGEERALLESLDSDEAGYEAVVGQQLSRLRSLDLLGDDGGDAASCPVCGSTLPEEDPHVEELRQAAADLQSRIGGLDALRPRRREALGAVSSRTEELRQSIRSVDDAIQAFRTDQRTVRDARQAAAQQTFLQGRIQQYLDTTEVAADDHLSRLRDAVELRRGEVERLEALLDPDEEREQLTTRLGVIGTDMTDWSQRLGLEHSGDRVRLDLRRLSVVAETPEGPAALNRIGSAANWIGYHLVTHLALHKYFREQARPVPQFLMLDQPTQAYYPSDTTVWSGEPVTDVDRQAVRELFQLIKDVVDELAPALQVVVCDHAFLAEEWFQDSIIENWRDGRKLIPSAWLTGGSE
jgi:hypothetical protein